MARLLSTVRVAELMEEERALLRELAVDGSRLLASIPMAGPEAAQMDRAARFLFRRWVLELLVLLRVRGPQGYNEIARALGGPAGESLSPKLRDLEAAALVTRSEIGGRPRRTSYALSPAGARLGSAVYALTIGKSEHARALQRGEGRVPVAVEPGPPSASPAEVVGRFAQAAQRFADLHARASAEGLEPRLETARRFAQACVHKWHSAVLVALAAGGPAKFGHLRAMTGAGDQALANALRELADVFGGVQRTGAGREATYRITPFGLYDLSIGAPLLLLLPQGSTKPE